MESTTYLEDGSPFHNDYDGAFVGLNRPTALPERTASHYSILIKFETRNHDGRPTEAERAQAQGGGRCPARVLFGAVAGVSRGASGRAGDPAAVVGTMLILPEVAQAPAAYQRCVATSRLDLRRQCSLGSGIRFMRDRPGAKP